MIALQISNKIDSCFEMPSDFERKWCGPLDNMTVADAFTVRKSDASYGYKHCKHKTLGPELIFTDHGIWN